MRCNDAHSPLLALSAAVIVSILLPNSDSSSRPGLPMHTISMKKSDCGKVSFF